MEIVKLINNRNLKKLLKKKYLTQETVWEIIDLEEMDGFEVKTITNNDLRDYNNPSQAYLDTLFKGISQNWPEMSDEDIWNYLGECMR